MKRIARGVGPLCATAAGAGDSKARIRPARDRRRIVAPSRPDAA